MSYTVYHADGTPVTIADGSVNTTYYNANSHGSGVGIGTQLVGRNTVNYGAPIAQNFLQLTENFASTSAFMPADAYALQGQLWFEKTSGTDGMLHVRTSSATSGGAANWKTLLTTDTSGNIAVRGGTVPAVNPIGTPQNGDIQVSGSVVSIYAAGAWHTTGSTTSGSTAPTSPTTGTLWYDTTTNTLKVYTNTGWTTVSTGSGGGGTSTAVATVGTTAPTSPVAGQLWYDTTVGVTALKIYTGTVWTIASSSGGGGSTGTVTSVIVNGTSGRLTSSGSPVTTSGIITMDLATTSVTPATYGSATQVPVFSVDAYGRVTSVTNTTITGSGGTGSGTVTSVTVNGTSGRLTSSGSPVTTSGTITMDLASSGVTSGTYGSATTVPVINVDAYGRVTSASSVAITGGTGSGTVTSVTVNGTSGRLTSSGSPVTTTGTITMDLAASGVSAGSYGSATQVPVINVDAYGRVTSASSVAITGGGAATTIRIDRSLENSTGPFTIPPWVPKTLRMGVFIVDTNNIAHFIELRDHEISVNGTTTYTGSMYSMGTSLSPEPPITDYVGPGQVAGTCNAATGTITLTNTLYTGYFNQWTGTSWTQSSIGIRFAGGPIYCIFTPA